MISYVLAPNPFTYFTDKQGNWLVYGKLRTLDWTTRQPKATYFDPAGQKPRANPIELDSIGRAIEIYWETTSSYYLELTDRYGNVVWYTAEPFVANGGSGGTITVNEELQNLFINGQMRFFPLAIYSPIPNSIPNVADGGWSYNKDGTNTTTTLQFVRYLPDNTDVDASPTYYLNYISTGAGTGETVNDLQYFLQDVRTLANEQITVSWNVRSALGGTYTCEVLALQYFGSASPGVTPSADVITSIMSINPTTVAADYSGTIILPALTGQTIGINGDDGVYILFRFPLNTNANIEAVNFYLKRGAPATDYPYESYAEVDATVKALALPDANNYTEFPTDTTVYPFEEAYDCISLKPVDGIFEQSWLSMPPVGSYFGYPSDIPPPGYDIPEGQVVPIYGKYYRLANVPFPPPTDFFKNAYGPVADQIVATTTSDPNTFIVIREMAGFPASFYSAGTSGFTLTVVSAGHSVEVAVGGNATPTWNVQNLNNDSFAVPASTTTAMPLTIISTGGSGPAEWEFTGIPATSIAGGQYILYNIAIAPGPVNVQRYVWFIKDGVGVDPAIPGATGYPVEISSNDTAVEVADATGRAIGGYESVKFTTLPANAITPGAYFVIYNGTTGYYIYYRIDGGGAFPPSPNGVPVEILSTDTATEVMTKTIAVLDPLLMQLPNFLPLFNPNGYPIIKL